MRGKLTLTQLGRMDKPCIIHMLRKITYLTLLECKLVADGLFDEGPQIIDMNTNNILMTEENTLNIDYLRRHVRSQDGLYDLFDMVQVDVVDENDNIIQHIHSDLFTIMDISDLRKVIKHSIQILIEDGNAPDALQDAVGLFNSITKNMKKRNMNFN